MIRLLALLVILTNVSFANAASPNEIPVAIALESNLATISGKQLLNCNPQLSFENANSTLRIILAPQTMIILPGGTAGSFFNRRFELPASALDFEFGALLPADARARMMARIRGTSSEKFIDSFVSVTISNFGARVDIGQEYVDSASNEAVQLDLVQLSNLNGFNLILNCQ